MFGNLREVLDDVLNRNQPNQVKVKHAAPMRGKPLPRRIEDVDPKMLRKYPLPELGYEGMAAKYNANPRSFDGSGIDPKHFGYAEDVGQYGGESLDNQLTNRLVQQGRLPRRQAEIYPQRPQKPGFALYEDGTVDDGLRRRSY